MTHALVVSCRFFMRHNIFYIKINVYSDYKYILINIFGTDGTNREALLNGAHYSCVDAI
jgi:hypothetical protein